MQALRRLSSTTMRTHAMRLAPEAYPATAAAVRFTHMQSKPKNEMPEDAPFLNFANSIGDAFQVDGEAFKSSANAEASSAPQKIYVPSIPHLLPVTRWATENAYVRDLLVFDETKRQKPRLSWYNPYDTTWAPTDWFSDGLMADMKYYFGEEGMNKKGGGMK